MVGKRTINILRDFKKALSKHTKVEHTLLFGSRAWGKPTKHSDFDIIVVSKSFRQKNIFQRSNVVRKYWNPKYPADFLCYTPAEFKKLSKQVTIVREAVLRGMNI